MLYSIKQNKKKKVFALCLCARVLQQYIMYYARFTFNGDHRVTRCVGVFIIKYRITYMGKKKKCTYVYYFICINIYYSMRSVCVTERAYAKRVAKLLRET